MELKPLPLLLARLSLMIVKQMKRRERRDSVGCKRDDGRCAIDASW